MKRVAIHFILISCLMAAACSNNSTQQETVIIETDSTVPKEITTAATDTSKKITPAASFELAATEEEDDPEFHQKTNALTWNEAGITDPLAFKQFLKKLKYWVVNDERDSIAKLIAYPLTHPPVKDQSDFLEQYDRLFSAKVKTAVQEQQLNKLVKTQQGVMLNGGVLWFKQTASGFKITFINY